MSNENENKEASKEETKSNKKYVVLALVVILAAVGIMMKNNAEQKATEPTTVASAEQAQVTEETPVVEEDTSVAEEPTIARIDITSPLVNADEPQFEVYVDNADEPLKQQGWMPKLGYQGVVVQKEGNEGIITIGVLSDAEIRIVLRGPDKRDENNQTVENWVKYTSLLVNGEEILPETIAVWHNRPFVYTINANAGDEVKVSAKWQKHNKE